MTLPWLKYNNVMSQSLGLYITDKGSYKAPARDVSYISIPGRDGDLIIDNGSYKNVKIPYKLALLSDGERDFATLVQLIKDWLCIESKYCELIDSYDEKYYRLAAFNSEIDIEQELTYTGKLSITFDCKPYRYLINGKNTITLTEPGTINNPEKYSSKPYIKINGSGNISLNINNDTFNFNNVDEYIEIDSELMITYKGLLSANGQMITPKYPKLIPGENNISWYGSINSIEVIPRWCCL